ncbi:MAG: CPBP family glutamic-type intramembrane protease [Nanoarchaeota archaeon]|nr:CPBP family glutamic-type intramembrane protease [Nanoarchaeota archaeon]
MKSYFLGFLGLLISLILICIVSRFLYLKKEKSTKRKIIIYSIVGSCLVIIYVIIGTLYFKQEVDRDSIFNTILFSLMLTPLFEELFYRRIILQHFLNLKKKKIRLKDILVIIGIGFSLIIPTFIFNYLGLLGSYSIKSLGIIAISLIIPLGVIWFYGKFKSKLANHFILVVLVIFQGFVFAFGHGEYAGYGQLVLGLITIILYINSKSIVPSLVSHYVWNVIVFLNNFR